MYLYIDTHTHIHTHNGILLSHKKNDILPFAAKLRELEGIMLSELNQKDKYCISRKIILIICII